MVVRVERVVDVAAPPERVWEFLDDSEHRAETISVVSSHERRDDDTMIWHVDIPVPLVRRTLTVETREDVREPPERVAFRGISKAFTVRGEHDLEPTAEGTRLTNRFVVDGRIPGVERFFEQKIDQEFDNLERALEAYLARTEA